MNMAVVGVVKAYHDQGWGWAVSDGRFRGRRQRMQDRGHEFGTVSGSPRRCGWLDLPMLKFAVRLNGTTELVLTKLDVLSGRKNESRGWILVGGKS